MLKGNYLFPDVGYPQLQLEKKRNSYMPRALHDGPHKQVLDTTTPICIKFHEGTRRG